METEKQSLGHFDRNSPVSLYALLGESWAKKFDDRLSQLPDLKELIDDETVLREHLEKVHSFIPNHVDNRYRMQLWLEYDNALRMNRKMKMNNIYSVQGSPGTFYNMVMKDPRRVAWMMCRPITYGLQIREILQTGMARLRRYLEVDAMAGGEIDYKLMKLQMDITRMADMREHGAPTQKIQSLEVKATMNANGELQELVDKGDYKALQERLEQYKKRVVAVEGAKPEPITPEIVDVEVIKE